MDQHSAEAKGFWVKCILHYWKSAFQFGNPIAALLWNAHSSSLHGVSATELMSY